MTKTQEELDAITRSEAIASRWGNSPILSKIQDLTETDLPRVLNSAYIAERFFGKSRSWMSQRLNGHIVNGKPARFTPEELETLRNALYTISIEIQGIADELQ